MGILDDLLAGAARGPGGGIPTQRPQSNTGGPNAALLALLPIVLSMIAHRGTSAGAGSDAGAVGGLGDILGGLLRQFDSAGLGDQARCWVSPGQNQPLAPDALGRVFGADGLAAIARQAGLSERETSAGLAQLLPEIIDRATPQGRVPDGDQLASTLQDLMRRFGA